MTVRALIELLKHQPQEAKCFSLSRSEDAVLPDEVHCVYIDKVGDVIIADGGMAVGIDEFRPADAPTAAEHPDWRTPTNPRA